MHKGFEKLIRKLKKTYLLHKKIKLFYASTMNKITIVLK